MRDVRGMRCLVTGASGFIGRRVCVALADAGAEVVGLGRGAAAPGTLDAVLGGWVRCDLADPGAVRRVGRDIGRVDALFHAAGDLADTQDLFALRERYVSEIVSPLLLADRGLDSPSRIVLFSSAAVYGAVAGPASEEAPLSPRGLYGVNKAVLEDAFGLFGRVRGCKVAILRVSAVYGPGMPEARAISRFIASLRRGERPVVSGPPNALRDYVYIDDVAEASVRAASCGADGVFNIASGAPVGLADLARLTARAMGRAVEPRVLSDATVPDKIFPVDKARRQLAFAPLCPAQGLVRMLQGGSC